MNTWYKISIVCLYITKLVYKTNKLQLTYKSIINSYNSINLIINKSGEATLNLGGKKSASIKHKDEIKIM